MTIPEHPYPWAVGQGGADPWQVVDANGEHLLFADSPSVARKIVDLANAEHTVIERSRRYLERAQRERSPL